jgi:hypothetical protein
LRLYDFSKDPKLMRMLDRRVNSMKGPWKGSALRHISWIREEYPEKRENDPNQKHEGDKGKVTAIKYR